MKRHLDIQRFAQPGKTTRFKFSWILFLLAISALLSGCGQPTVESENVQAESSPEPAEEPKPRWYGDPGRWRLSTPRGREADGDESVSEMIDQLEAIGYFGGSQEGPPESGVVIHDPERSYQGYNFYTSGHAPEAFLMDMEGNELYRWGYDFQEAFPDYELPKGNKNDQFWRRAHLFENGDVLAIYEGLALIKIDKNSNLLWAYPGKAHHDLMVTDEGLIYVLTRKGELIPRLHEESPVLEDFVTILDAEGREQKKISILEAYENSEFSHALNRFEGLVEKTRGDIFHTNTLQVFDGSLERKSPLFKKGNMLIASLMLKSIAIIDGDSGVVAWAWLGSWGGVHEPVLLENGSLLFYDNHGNGEDKSQVIEVDFFTREEIWVHRGDPSDPYTEFYSPSCGTCVRLPNGNILITVSDNGRAIEVTPDHEIVWEFVNPRRAGDENQYIATLLEVVRIPASFPMDWMGRSQTESASF